MPARRIGRQLRLVPALLVPTTRAVGWGPPLAAFAVSLGLLALAVRPGLDAPRRRSCVQWVRLAIIAAALGYAFLLDDPSEPTTEGVAGSLLLRQDAAVALLLPATAAWWVAVVWRVRAVHPAMSLPVAALTLEAAALLAVTLALAAAGSRLAPERRGGVVAAPALLALACAASLLPAQVAMYAQPGSAAWDTAHRRWAVLLGLALATFAAASRDPAQLLGGQAGQRWLLVRRNPKTGELASTAAGHQARSHWPPWSGWLDAAGPSRSASRPARAWWAWISIRSAAGAPGTAGPPWPCSLTPSSWWPPAPNGPATLHPPGWPP